MATNYKGYHFTMTINAREYTFKYPGHTRAMQILDESKDQNGNIKATELNKRVLEEIVVSPRVTLDFFDEHPYIDDFEDVTRIAGDALNGKFPRNEAADEKRSAQKGA